MTFCSEANHGNRTIIKSSPPATTASEYRGGPKPGDSGIELVLQTLAFEGRKLLGAILLLLGVLMMSTLLLLPVGLPLASLPWH